jgi:protein-S-isoprenylcysteine O-methyltransferase Ste14
MKKRMLRWLVATAILGSAVLLGGNSSDPWLWAYVGAFGALGLVAMASMDDELVRERFNPPDPGADRLSLRFVRLVALFHVVIGILDSRFGWTHVAELLRAVGVVGFSTCFLLIIHAARTNRYFSSVVRIQSERGHRVVDSGPYGTIRHPGYAAMLPLAQFSALALGSWLAFGVAFAYSVLIFKRVLFEDRFLHERLPDYRAYAGRVRYRLIPRVW